MTEIIKDKILRSDAAWYDGLTATRSKKDSTGGTITSLKLGTEVDVIQVYGGGVNYTASTITKCIEAIGSTSVTLLFQPGTWTIDTDITVGSNFVCRIPAGVVFSVSSGKTLTFSGPVIRDAQTWTGGSGTVTENGTRYLSGKIDASSAVFQGATPLVFEGTTDNAFETRFTFTDPTADRVITFPDADVDLTSILTAAGSYTISGSWTFSGVNTFSGLQIFSGVLSGKIPIPTNVGLTATVGSNALTIALKGADGNDPSATNPVYVPFRNVTLATGTPTWIAVTAPTSLVISSGSMLGTQSGVLNRIAVVAFNDGGTFRLGAMGLHAATASYTVDSFTIQSSTAEGGAGGADSAGVFYTGSAVTSKAMTVLGIIESTQATAGTWATAPSKIQLGMDALRQYDPARTGAWVAFNGTGTLAITGSYNVTSVTDNGTGNYSPQLTVAFLTTGNSYSGNAKVTNNTTGEGTQFNCTTPATGSWQIVIFDGSLSNPVDAALVSSQAWGQR
ncbi:MAG: hypothetical protein PHE50_00190 [Dehalococcoidales bacterium]|nr:hypothetical protein [Dehalococcoidales bacterium]